jgi:hypothetical protein
MSNSESAAPACEEKRRLVNLCAVTKSEYSRAMEAIALRIGELNISHFDELAEFAKDAKKAMEEAREALERHTAEHGC